jgi:hypothetical protein
MRVAHGGKRDDASQVVVQRAALVGRITRCVIVTIAVVAEMMMVSVVHRTCREEIGCGISLDLADMLQMSRG